MYDNEQVWAGLNCINLPPVVLFVLLWLSLNTGRISYKLMR